MSSIVNVSQLAYERSQTSLPTRFPPPAQPSPRIQINTSRDSFFTQPQRSYFSIFSSTPSTHSSSHSAQMDQLEKISSQLEDFIDTIGQPIRPYIPAIARFLIVVTFYEDAIRIVTQWGDQLYYLERHRGFWWGASHIFLIFNVVTMAACSSLIITKRYQEPAIAGLFLVVISQSLGYGLIFDMSFFLRNLSVLGGLLMVLSDSLSRRRQMFAALPQISETDKRTYFQLAGRILLIFLFIGFIFNGEWSIVRVLVSLGGLAACIMVAIGFKAKWSAMFLVLFLSVFNVLVNNWWSVQSTHPQRDFLKYDFFQTLSIMGGLLLLVSVGPGGLSMDEKKKAF